MTSQSPIIVVEDDVDDQLIIQKTFDNMQMSKKIIFFDNATMAYDYLLTTTDQPFIIISDINMPGVNGIDFRRKIQENDYLRMKAIPFVFFTTSASRKTVAEAFALMVQGFFTKSSTMEAIASQLRIILEYWHTSAHPN